jgi:hypothetical protein
VGAVPPPVRPRRVWLVCATTAVTGTLAAALLPSPWSIACGVIAALGAIGAFVAFVVIVVLEGEDGGGQSEPARAREPFPTQSGNETTDDDIP